MTLICLLWLGLVYLRILVIRSALIKVADEPKSISREKETMVVMIDATTIAKST